MTEILIAAGVAAVLGVILVAVLMIDRQNTRDARRISDIRQIQAALEMHYNDENAYPIAIQPGAPLVGETGGITYMNLVPTDPLGAAGYGYRYVAESPYSTYVISFSLERGISGFSKGVHRATSAGIE